MIHHLGRRLLQNLAGSKGFFTRPNTGLRLNPLQCSRFVPFPVAEQASSTTGFYSKVRCLSTSVKPKPNAQQAQTLDDFQHEEITGPTVDRDVSATANELRESIDSMLAYNKKLKRALATIGCMQLAVGWWVVATHYSSENLFLFYTGLSAGISLQLAYVLHQALKPLPFFQRVEERSRMRVLTLSMQSIKAVTNVLSRSNVVVRYTVVGLGGAFVYEVFQHFVKIT